MARTSAGVVDWLWWSTFGTLCTKRDFPAVVRIVEWWLTSIITCYTVSSQCFGSVVFYVEAEIWNSRKNARVQVTANGTNQNGHTWSSFEDLCSCRAIISFSLLPVHLYNAIQHNVFSLVALTAVMSLTVKFHFLITLLVVCTFCYVKFHVRTYIWLIQKLFYCVICKNFRRYWDCCGGVPQNYNLASGLLTGCYGYILASLRSLLSDMNP